MKDFDFEQVQGCEPTAVMPFRPAGSSSDVSYDTPATRAAAQVQQLDDLIRQMHLPDSKETLENSISIPLKPKPRQFTRLPVSQVDSIAEFHVLGRRYDCRLIEMSIGGFGIYLPRLMSIHPGTLGQLCAPGLNFVVSVSRIEPKDGGVIIGLRQIEEVIEDAPFQMAPRPSAVSYLIAVTAGILIAAIGFYFINGHH